MSYHARLSPSSSARWTTCTASPSACDGVARSGGNADSRFGTTGHQILEEVLTDPSRDLMSYLGRKMVFWVHPESESSGEDWEDQIGVSPDPNLEFVDEVEVTEDMLDGVAKALDYIQQQHALLGGDLMAEQSVPIGQFTGEPGATGSADVILLTPPVVRIKDLKMGRHRVYASEVTRPEGTCPITGEHQPEIRQPNLQLVCYALGALWLYDLFGEFTHVTLTILQPMIGHTDEYTLTIDELREWEQFLRQKAEETRTNPVFRPSADACHYCPRSGNCEAQTAAVFAAATDGFDDAGVPQVASVRDVGLGSRYALLPMIRSWCDATEERVRAKLLAGEPVVRDDGLSYKLIEGRATRRTWTDEDGALLTLHDAAGDRAYQPRKVISPTMAEALSKSKRVKKGDPKIPPVITAEQWSALQPLITQGQAKPTIVLETDPNPPIAKSADGFDEVET